MSQSALLRSLVAALLAGTCLGTAQAHSELPTSTWCATGRVVEVASFQIQPATLQQLRIDDTCPPEGTPTEKDCGQFDDDYALAQNAAGQACSAYGALGMQTAGGQGTGDVGSVVVLVESPPQYLTPTHHADYVIDLGVSGVCVRCERVDGRLPPRRHVPVTQ